MNFKYVNIKQTHDDHEKSLIPKVFQESLLQLTVEPQSHKY